MAIQIDEKLLSQKAKDALSNSKSKSKLLRDALEAYVRSSAYEAGSSSINVSGDPQLKQDIKEIKEMLLRLTTGEINSQLVIHTVEHIKTAQKDLGEKSEASNIRQTDNNKKDKPQKDNDEIDNSTEKREAVIPNIKGAEGLSEEKKKEIEGMYDSLLDTMF